MTFRNRITASTITMLLTFVFVLMMAVPSWAGYSGTGVPVTEIGPNGRTLTVTGTYNGQGRTGAYECPAVATGDVAATRVLTCEIRVNNVSQGNSPAAAPGPAAVGVGAHTTLPNGTSYNLCYRAQAVFLDNSTLTTKTGCTPVNVSF